MEVSKTYVNYPAWIVILSNLSAVLIYSSGFIIIQHSGWVAAFIYLLFILGFEYRLISTHCVNCYYWGLTCGFGKGRLSALFLKKGDPMKFCNNEMTWKDLVPDLLISLIPLIFGIVLMIIKFDIILLLATLLIAGLSTFGNGFVRGKLTCRYCKQRESGCPAEKLFSKK
jgi:hypothetical protein